VIQLEDFGETREQQWADVARAWVSSGIQLLVEKL
jgi:hypothetical protein